MTENLTEQQVAEASTLLADLVTTAATKGLLATIPLGDEVKVRNLKSATAFRNGKRHIKILALSREGLFEQKYLITIALGGYEVDRVPTGEPRRVHTQDYSSVVLRYNVSRETLRYRMSEISS